MDWLESRITSRKIQTFPNFQHTACQLLRFQTMVLNRLDDPRSKLGLLAWLETVYLPTIAPDAIAYPHLLRAMDFLIQHQKEIEDEIARRFMTIFDSQLTLCFYDVTSSYFEGETEVPDDIRKHGYSRYHRRDCRQVVIGVVMNRDGIPLAHYTFPGNTADRGTVIEVMSDIRRRFGVKKVILVGDKGMTSRAIYGWLADAGANFILGESKRIGREAREALAEAETARLARPEAERETAFVYETGGTVAASVKNGEKTIKSELPGRRIFSYNPATAVKQAQRRQRSLDGFFDLANEIKASRRSPEEAYHLLRDCSKRHGMCALTVIPANPLAEDVALDAAALRFEEQADGWFAVFTED